MGTCPLLQFAVGSGECDELLRAVFAQLIDCGDQLIITRGAGRTHCDELARGGSGIACGGFGVSFEHDYKLRPDSLERQAQ